MGFTKSSLLNRGGMSVTCVMYAWPAVLEPPSSCLYTLITGPLRMKVRS